MNDLSSIDVEFDFTTDTPKYWDNFWHNNMGLGAGGNDPDIKSKTLQKYHQILWSRQLPNGEFMDLKMGTETNYLTWKNFRFGSDSIIASFRYRRYKYMLDKVQEYAPNYKTLMENFLRKSYTIGGMIIFPKRKGGINQSRGINPFIKDRWDMTLECIRRYYNAEQSPMYDVLLKDKAFFDLFIDFKGYVDYFFLQDCVSSDYESVNFWLGDGELKQNPLPQTPEEYVSWIECELEFVKKRNNRIRNFINEQ